MKEKGFTAAVLVLVFLTFWFWLSAMVTPGWFVLSRKFNSSSVKKTPVSVELSIFYCTFCKDGQCVNFDYNQLPKRATSILPGLGEIQYESVCAVLLCTICFCSILLSCGSSTSVKAGCVTLISASLIELILVVRMGFASSALKDDDHPLPIELESETIYMIVQCPYSIILAALGFVPSILAMCFGVALSSKLNKRETEGWILNVVPSSSYNVNYRILQESV